MVETSVFGLWVRPIVNRSSRPVVRVEYVRAPTTRHQPSAHIQFHAESADLAWIYGSAGIDLPGFDSLHFPAGGRRFRPTIEDFLFFLHREQLFTDWRPGWEEVLQAEREEWERIQARSKARRFPDEVVGYLRSEGWTVEPASS